ncbi:hypothetical protein CROQUDRAFT_664501 [Cronartium quercuum f. sp. fusiforme G11]|uniref:Uncharacterized protein n=1 Tax=Cronartium quercuum f. sp. fusiforme G11 TaxID=708437 RepID=A0A9P6T6V5_9BASI|nr:hypothetical protein CROQUDRAFT_664501 [Cronartium quercuum f. sp. fusiforme G11]
MTIVRNSGDQLKKNGSNYREWEHCIRDLIDDYTEPGWLDRKNAHVDARTGDRIVLMMIKYCRFEKCCHRLFTHGPRLASQSQ